MDAKDLAIVHALLGDPLGSVAAVARAAGLGDTATRQRIRRLRDQGILGAVSVLPSGHVLGREYLVCLYPDGGDWRDALRVPSVVGSSVNHEGVVAPTCLVDPGAGPPDDVVARYGAPARTFVQGDPPLDPPGGHLSALQWRVLTAFVAAPQATVRDLAKTTGLTARTVRRHRDALVRGGHVRLELELRCLRGDHVLFHLYVQGPGTHPATALRDRMRPHVSGAWVTHQLQEPRGVLLFCAAPSLADAAGAPRAAMALDGVDHAELVVSRDGGYDTTKLVVACQQASAQQAAALQP